MNRKYQKQIRQYMINHGLKPSLNDGGCSVDLDVSIDKLKQSLEILGQRQLKKILAQ